jgi:hypothetical protein
MPTLSKTPSSSNKENSHVLGKSASKKPPNSSHSISQQDHSKKILQT